MVEIQDKGLKEAKVQREHNTKIILMDDKNKEQYDHASGLGLYSQKKYLEGTAEDNDASILHTFLRYSSLLYLLIFLTTFLSLHASSIGNLFSGKWKAKMGWAMLRDFGIGAGVFVLWYGAIYTFFIRRSARSRN